jgi:hypothetical protein
MDDGVTLPERRRQVAGLLVDSANAILARGTTRDQTKEWIRRWLPRLKRRLAGRPTP